MDAGYAFSVVAGAALALGALTAIFASVAALISSREGRGREDGDDDEDSDSEGGGE